MTRWALGGVPLYLSLCVPCVSCSFVGMMWNYINESSSLLKRNCHCTPRWKKKSCYWWSESRRHRDMLRWYEGVWNGHLIFFFFHHSSPRTDVPVFPRSLIRHIVHRVQNSLCDSLGEIPTCNTSRKSLFFNVPLYVVPPLGENCSLSSLSFRQTKDLEIRNFIVAALTLYNRSRVLGI